MTTTKQFAYARVSSKEQNLDRQLEALKAYVSDERDIIADKASGKDMNRAGWKFLESVLRPGDELTIVSLDRLSRNYEDLRSVWKALTDKGVKIRVLDMPAISTADKADGGELTAQLISDITLSLLAYVAETERAHIKARQRQGIETAKAKGTHMGRPKYQKPEDYDQIMQEYLSGAFTAERAAKKLGVSRAKFFSLLKEFKAENS